MNERRLETIIKGFANKRRILVLQYLGAHPEADLGEVANMIKLDITTVSEHVRKMAIAGLVMKRNEGSRVCHALTKRGKSVLMFLKNMQ